MKPPFLKCLFYSIYHGCWFYSGFNILHETGKKYMFTDTFTYGKTKFLHTFIFVVSKFIVDIRQQFHCTITDVDKISCNEKICKYTAYTRIIITNLFIWQCKIFIYGEPLSVFCRSSFSACRCRCQIINDRVWPCITDQVKIRVFVNNRNKTLFHIPAVTKDDNIFLLWKFRHNLADHRCGKLQFWFFFLPHPIT